MNVSRSCCSKVFCILSSLFSSRRQSSVVSVFCSRSSFIVHHHIIQKAKSESFAVLCLRPFFGLMFPPLLVPWYPLLVGTTNNTVPTTTTQQISTEEIARQAPARKLASYDSTVVIPYPYLYIRSSIPPLYKYYSSVSGTQGMVHGTR